MKTQIQIKDYVRQVLNANRFAVLATFRVSVEAYQLVLGIDGVNWWNIAD